MEKVILITGALRGIGKENSKLLLKKSIEEIEKLGFKPFEVDVSMIVR